MISGKTAPSLSSPGELPGVECHIYLARLAALQSSHIDILSSGERERWGRLLRDGDRTRFALATVVLRSVIAARLGLSPSRVVVDRRCPRCYESHGPPMLPGTDLHASISHSDDLVAVAVTTAGPVGIDIEALRKFDYGCLLEDVCIRSERQNVNSIADFFTYWTRKESLLKATQDGIAVPMTSILVSPPDDPPQLYRYQQATRMVAQMVDLYVGEEYLGSTTVLTDDRVVFRLDDASRYLGSEQFRAQYA